MTGERHARVKQLFLEAIELDEKRRQTFLDSACGGDVALRHEVESLLEHHDPRTIILDPQSQDTRELGSAETLAGEQDPPRRTVRGFGRLRLVVGPTGQLALGGVIATLVLAVIGYWVYAGVRTAMRELWADRLEYLVDAEVTALESWLENEESFIQSWAREPLLRDYVEDLLEIGGHTPAAKEELANSPLHRSMRELLRELAGREIEYVVWDRTGMVVSTSSAVEEALAQQAGSAEAAILADVYQGETIVRLPFHSRIARSEGDASKWARPIMSVLTPIHRDADDAVVAALAVGGPEMWEEFNEILSEVQAGESGETYAFDARGLMISESRFNDQLKDLGLLADGPSAQSSLTIEIRDPGGRLSGGNRSPLPLLARPFTRAAAEAIAGRDGVELNGYRDYRGVTVVGAWRWLPEHNFGVVTEVDFEEATVARRYFDVAFGLLFGLLVLSVATVFLSSYRIGRLQRQIGEAMKLGPYTLEEKIGEGGMGEVYNAKHALLKRKTAIKLLKPSLMSGEAIGRFEREVQIASQLTHPNTIEIYDYGRTPVGVFYYAMEYLSGLTLNKLVAIEGPLPPARVVYLLSQVCGSLREAHAVGLVHRDISPNNVMLCRRGGLADVVKVLDFGLAKPVNLPEKQEITVSGTLAGTPLYIAPERFRNPMTTDPRLDLYSVGSVAYKLLTGRDVFEGLSHIELLYQLINTRPKRPSECVASDIPPALEELVMGCLAKEPQDRPDSVGEVLDVLEGIETADRWDQKDACDWWDRHEARLREPQTLGSS